MGWAFMKDVAYAQARTEKGTSPEITAPLTSGTSHYFGEGKGIILHTKIGTKSFPVIILLTSPMGKGGIGEDGLRLMRLPEVKVLS